MSKIIVCGLPHIESSVREHGATRLVSLLQSEFHPPRPAALPPEHHLLLDFNDIVEEMPEQIVPTVHDIEALLDFSRGWDRDEALVIHCFAGVSRSMAGAMILLAEEAGPGHEMGIARMMRERAAHAQPNRLMVQLADAHLGLDGRLVAAAEAMGPGDLSQMGRAVELPSRYRPG
ncbi:MAG: hypothetical protein PVG98_14815 [Chromatiales bacterium]